MQDSADTLDTIDSNGKIDSKSDEGELLFEARHNLAKRDYIVYFGIVIVVGICACIYATLEPSFIDIVSMLLMVGIICFVVIRDLFLLSKNRFYITSKGIGFVKHSPLGVEEGFFQFGEVGIEKSLAGNFLITRHSVFRLFPLQGDKSSGFKGAKIHVIANKFFLSPKLNATKDFDVKEFLLHKIQENTKNMNIEAAGDWRRFRIFCKEASNK